MELIAAKIKPRMHVDIRGRNYIVHKTNVINKYISIEGVDQKGNYTSDYILKDTKIKRIPLTKEIKQAYKGYLTQGVWRNLTKAYCDSGSDPEIFVVDKKGEVIPAFEFLGGKDKPTKVDVNSKALEGHTNRPRSQPLFWDGFQAEFNTHADTCLSWVIDSIFLALNTLNIEAKKHNPDARITIRPTIDVSPEQLENAKTEHVEFGCMPSYNAYGMEGLKRNGREVQFRSAGGHLHFGIDGLSKDKARIESYVKALDRIVGVACVALFQNFDDPRRRILYGLAGEYRMPKHGMEYRTLSNVWMCHPLIVNVIYDLARRVLSAVDKNIMDAWKTTDAETIACINNCDVKLAKKILKRNKFIFEGLMFSISYDKDKAKVLNYVFNNGVETIIANPDDVEGNWKLNDKFQGHCEGQGMTVSKMASLDTYNKLLKAVKDA